MPDDIESMIFAYENGLTPYTGEYFPDDYFPPELQPDINRALHWAEVTFGALNMLLTPDQMTRLLARLTEPSEDSIITEEHIRNAMTHLPPIPTSALPPNAADEARQHFDTD